MSDNRLAQLEEAIDKAGLRPQCSVSVRENPSGLSSIWVDLADTDALPALASALRDGGGRLATTTVYRPDAKDDPDAHEITYHMVLGGSSLTIKVVLCKDQSLPTITHLFPNANWEERELMELSGITVADHPNPRRLLLDESIEAGVFDRLVPYSEITDSTNHEAVWARIKEAASTGQLPARPPAEEDGTSR